MKREQELRGLGATEAQILELLGADEEDGVAVFSDNWKTLEVFLACNTQWRVVAGFSGVVFQGLDYQSVESVLRLLKIDGDRELFEGMKIMEKAAMETLNG